MNRLAGRRPTVLKLPQRGILFERGSQRYQVARIARKPELKRPSVRSKSRTFASCWRKTCYRPKVFSMNFEPLLVGADRSTFESGFGESHWRKQPRAHRRDGFVEGAP